jgi:enoyl-CoA hydratase/carnithine racemase
MTKIESTDHIKANYKDGILELEIYRRDKKNALTEAMYQSLTQNIQFAHINQDIRVIYLHGQEDLFTSGNDLGEFVKFNLSEESSALQFLKAIANCPLPIVAAVGGDAIGIGTTLLLHCDLVIASTQARFQLPFVNLGLCPEGASSYLLPIQAGHKLSNQLLLLGNSFDASVAHQAGLINSSYPKEQILQRGLEMCKQLASKPYDSIMSTKRLLKQHHQKSTNDALETEFSEFLHLLQQPASKEILRAFLEKRAPNIPISKLH